VDLNSIGRGSNAHGLAGLLGLVAFVASAAPSVLIMLVVSKWLERPSLVPVLLLVWCVVAYAIGRILFLPARKIFAKRRENLAMIR
jgi:chromate transport protein ChrA